MAGQLKLSGLNEEQLREAASAASVVGSLSTWLYGIEYDRERFERELADSAEHMRVAMAGARR